MNVRVKRVNREKLPDGVEIENDMVESLRIVRDRGFMLCLEMRFKSGRQPLFCGYNNTSNIGHMIVELADVLDVNPSGDSANILDDFSGTPVRVATVPAVSGIYCENVWLGHFMKDEFVHASDVVKCGIREK